MDSSKVEQQALTLAVIKSKRKGPVNKNGKRVKDGKRLNLDGITLVIDSKGRERFKAQFRVTGRQHESKTYDTRLQAERWLAGKFATVPKHAASLEVSNVKLGDTLDADGSIIEAGVFTLHLAHLEEHKGPQPGWRVREYNRLKTNPVLRDVYLRDVDAALAITYCKARRDGVSGSKRRTKKTVHASTVLVEFIYVAAAVNEVAYKLGFGDFNPWGPRVKEQLFDLKLVRKSTQRPFRPSAAQMETLHSTFKRTFRTNDARVVRKVDGLTLVPMNDIAEVARVNAFRVSEIAGLRWADLDVEHSGILCRERKYAGDKEVVKDVDTGELEEIGKHMLIPLINGTLEILLRQPRKAHIRVGEATPGVEEDDPDNRIFPYTSQNISKRWKMACDENGIKNLRFHDLRHDAISTFTANPLLSTSEAMQISGHTTESSMRRYVKNNREDILSITKKAGMDKAQIAAIMKQMEEAKK